MDNGGRPKHHSYGLSPSFPSVHAARHHRYHHCKHDDGVYNKRVHPDDGLDSPADDAGLADASSLHKDPRAGEDSTGRVHKGKRHFCPRSIGCSSLAHDPDLGFLPQPLHPSCWRQVLGIYVVLLQENESPAPNPIMYIGSGTSVNGVRSRMRMYWNKTLLPSEFQKPIAKGGKILSVGLLCQMPAPSHENTLATRALAIALEATFTYAFWTLRHPQHGKLMEHMALWSHDSLQWKGGNSHNPLMEILWDWEMTP